MRRKGRIFSAALAGCMFIASACNAEVAEREVFWGTPNFSYAARALPPSKLSGIGVNYVSHLLYWQNFETAPGVWNEAFFRNQLAFFEDLAEHGIVSGIRLGEAHPGANAWSQENGKLYEGRHRQVYPGVEDTDERYFEYLGQLARRFRGKVDHYVLGDEIDMIYGASFRDEARLREYFDFFERAAAVISKEDPDAKLVVFPFAWGETVRNAKLLDAWGIGKFADGFCLNMARTDTTSPDYLADIAAGIKALSPDYGLYSNGFGYLSNLAAEDVQAAELAHNMIRIWQSGWNYLPYYTLASNAHPWSTGLYQEELVKGEILPRQALGVFERLSNRLSRNPRLSDHEVQILAVETPFGDVDAEEFPTADIQALWQSDDEGSFGILQFIRSGDPRILNVTFEIPGADPGMVLEVVDAVDGSVRTAEVDRNPETGRTTLKTKVRNEPLIVRWVVGE